MVKNKRGVKNSSKKLSNRNILIGVVVVVVLLALVFGVKSNSSENGLGSYGFFGSFVVGDDETEACNPDGLPCSVNDDCCNNNCNDNFCGTVIGGCTINDDCETGEICGNGVCVIDTCNGNGNSDGICEAGEGACPDDCDESCSLFEDNSGSDCDGICNTEAPFDEPLSLDCIGGGDCNNDGYCSPSGEDAISCSADCGITTTRFCDYLSSENSPEGGGNSFTCQGNPDGSYCPPWFPASCGCIPGVGQIDYCDGGNCVAIDSNFGACEVTTTEGTTAECEGPEDCPLEGGNDDNGKCYVDSDSSLNRCVECLQDIECFSLGPSYYCDVGGNWDCFELV